MKRRLRGRSHRTYLRTHGPLVITKEYEKPPEINWNDDTYAGDAYGAYAWACDVAEVEVDPDTFEVRPVRVTAVHEIGRAIHPGLAIGQIEGGTLQGIGYGLIEHVAMRDGVMANAQLTNYIIPTPVDIPPIRVYFDENPYAYGPGGAKGIGELPMDGAAPAILNAIENATGASFTHIPLMPERLMERYEK